MSKQEREALDEERRHEVVSRVTERRLEAVASDSLDDKELFGLPVSLFDISDETGVVMRVYSPGLLAQESGYVPRAWIEFLLPGAADGLILEVTDDDERLIRASEAASGIGSVPSALPVTDTRVMVARAAGILRDGVIVPCQSRGVA